MPTQEAPAFAFERTGTLTEVERALREENFGGNKNARELQNAAIALIDVAQTNGIRVTMKETVTRGGYRYVQLTLVDVPLLIHEDAAEQRGRGREMRS